MVALSTALALAKMGYGAYQLYQGHKLGSMPRTDMEIPAGIKQMLTTQRTKASQRTGVQDATERALARRDAENFQRLIEGSSNPSDIVSGMNKANVKGNETLLAAALEDQQLWRDDQDALARAEETMGGWQFQRDKQNIYDREQERYDKAAALDTSGALNVFSGFEGAASQQASNQFWDKYVGGMDGTDTSDEGVLERWKKLWQMRKLGMGQNVGDIYSNTNEGWF